jgi:hypothetical protein
MRVISIIFQILLGCAVAAFLCWSYFTVISGGFTWDGPSAPWIVCGFIVMVLRLSYIMWKFRWVHRRAFGLIQIFIGCAILISRLGSSGNSDVNQTLFLTELLAALFFFVNGIDDYKSDRRVRG